MSPSGEIKFCNNNTQKLVINLAIKNEAHSQRLPVLVDVLVKLSHDFWKEKYGLQTNMVSYTLIQYKTFNCRLVYSI